MPVVHAPPSPEPALPESGVLIGYYEIPEGIRLLLGERIRGKVAVIDKPADHDGRVYLVERAVPSLAELDGLVAEYRACSDAAGMPAVLASPRTLDDIAESV